MSGYTIDPDAPGITATDDEAVAKAHGLNFFDEESGQYVKRDVAEHGGNEDPAREQVWSPSDLSAQWDAEDAAAVDGETAQQQDADQERLDREQAERDAADAEAKDAETK